MCGVEYGFVEYVSFCEAVFWACELSPVSGRFFCIVSGATWRLDRRNWSSSITNADGLVR